MSTLFIHLIKSVLMELIDGFNGMLAVKKKYSI